MSNTIGMITLREAYKRWVHETGVGNAYNWYRRSAQQGRAVFGTQDYARKVGRSWLVDVAAFEHCIEIDRAAKAHAVRMTADYQQHILHGGIGSTTCIKRGY